MSSIFGTIVTTENLWPGMFIRRIRNFLYCHQTHKYKTRTKKLCLYLRKKERRMLCWRIVTELFYSINCFKLDLCNVGVYDFLVTYTFPNIQVMCNRNNLSAILNYLGHNSLHSLKRSHLVKLLVYTASLLLMLCRYTCVSDFEVSLPVFVCQECSESVFFFLRPECSAAQAFESVTLPWINGIRNIRVCHGWNYS